MNSYKPRLWPVTRRLSRHVSPTIHLLLAAWILILLILPGTARAASPEQELPVARAVLFFSPSCGHCHKVMTEDLPPLYEKYGSQLQILEINTATQEGRELFTAAIDAFNIESRGVPLMIFGTTVMIGSVQIPAMLPGLIDTALAADGVDWPAIPGLESVLPDSSSALAAPATVQEQDPASPPKTRNDAPPATNISAYSGESIPEGPLWLARFNNDRVGNSIAVVVLLAMAASVISIGITFVNTEDTRKIKGLAGYKWSKWSVPLVSVIGLLVAGYMSFVEVKDIEAICGPVGDCNTVQQSPYAMLWGFIPVGIFGVIGYAGILAAWVVSRYSSSRDIKKIGELAMWGMALVGTLFSIYLTFLEPFVIGATCAWCVASAVLITLLLWITTRPALKALET
jgi:uncharacterized membrane protein